MRIDALIAATREANNESLMRDLLKIQRGYHAQHHGEMLDGLLADYKRSLAFREPYIVETLKEAIKILETT